MVIPSELLKIARSLKKDIVEITPYYVCGTDNQMCTFSIVYLDIPVKPDIYYIGYCNLINKDEERYNQYIFFYDAMKRRLDELRRSCQIIQDNNKVIFSADNIIDQDIFNGLDEAIKLKAYEGANMIYPEFSNYLMSYCPSIHPLNKSDQMNLVLYEYDDISFFAKYMIIKKEYTINEYIRFIYVTD